MATSSPLLHRLSIVLLSAMVLISAMALAACGQQTAEFDNNPPVIGGTQRGPAPTATPGSDPLVPVTSATAAPQASTPEPTAPTAAAEPVQTEATPEPTGAPTSAPVAASDNDPTNEFALDGIGGELGCENATTFWLALRETAVRDIVDEMQRDIWLCPGTPEVAAALSCFYDEMARLLVALEERLTNGVLLADDLRRGDQVFCRSEYVISLRPEDILERQEEERLRQEQQD